MKSRYFSGLPHTRRATSIFVSPLAAKSSAISRFTSGLRATGSKCARSLLRRKGANRLPLLDTGSRLVHHLATVKAAATRKAAALAFASKLNSLLAEKNISRRELARRLSDANDVSFETARTNVHRLLRAEHVPNESTRHEVAAALGIDPADLEEDALAGDPFRVADAAASPRRRAGRGRSADDAGAEVAA